MKKRITSEKICETKSYNGVDIVKLICAFFVCIIHIPIFPSKTAGLSFFEQDGYGLANFFLAQGICRIAVPFFFVATGFFFFRKTAESTIDKSAVEKYCFKLFRLIGIWMFLLFVGKTDHMWYLFASILGVILLSFCIYKKICYHISCPQGIPGMGCQDPTHEASDIKQDAPHGAFFISDEKLLIYRSGGLRINRISTQYFVIVLNLLTTLDFLVVFYL